MLATICFFYFGVTLLRDAQGMKATDLEEELHEVQTELEKKDLEDASEESGLAVSKQDQVVIVQAFTLTFLAEWGDRSQIATIALGAARNVVGVTLGGILGHTLCTSFAVFGGHMIASRVSEKQVTIIGGTVFLICAFMSAYYVYVEDFAGGGSQMAAASHVVQ
jgi:putative Ca2+/H+ antiporter (TMEM165/GDT1 family)